MLDQGGCLSLYRLPCRVDHTVGVDRIRYGCDLTALRGSSIARHTATHVLPNPPNNLPYVLIIERFMTLLTL